MKTTIRMFIHYVPTMSYYTNNTIWGVVLIKFPWNIRNQKTGNFSRSRLPKEFICKQFFSDCFSGKRKLIFLTDIPTGEYSFPQWQHTCGEIIHQFIVKLALLAKSIISEAKQVSFHSFYRVSRQDPTASPHVTVSRTPSCTELVSK